MNKFKASREYKCGVCGHVIKKELYRHIQNTGHFKQTAGTDPVGALLIFLDLLEREVEVLAELFLAHAHQHAAHPQPASNVNVDRVWHFRSHFYQYIR